MRLAAITGCHLHLIEPLGFELNNTQLKRAGLDYLVLNGPYIHKDFDSFKRTVAFERLFYITSKGARSYHQVKFAPQDAFVFGSETQGLPDALRAANPEQCLRLPMLTGNRSLNLSNAVAIMAYEAWRQNGFIGGS